MFESLKLQLGTASYASTYHQKRAAGAVMQATDRLASFGANVALADSGSATTVALALSIARQNVAAQSFAGADKKQQALGVIDRLAGELASLGVS